MDARRGFVTIATGNQKYYQLAVDLLKSYRVNGKSTLPFAIICDRDCPEAREFDDMVLISDPHHSYLDKLALYRNIPYDETIFIDADALILSPIDNIWDDFASMGDFSCYGTALPLNSQGGWFVYEDMGELKQQLNFGVSMHGGIYYLRKTDTCRDIFENAENFVKNYDKYHFAEFNKPADEPVLALSMALANCKPCSRQNVIAFLPRFDGKLRVNNKGELKLGRKPFDAIVLHFSNRYIPRFLYQYLRANVLHRYEGHNGTISFFKRIRLRLKYLPADTRFFTRRVLLKILPKKLIENFRNRKK